jgi:hypothetical protein
MTFFQGSQHSNFGGERWMGWLVRGTGGKGAEEQGSRGAEGLGARGMCGLLRYDQRYYTTKWGLCQEGNSGVFLRK